MAKQTINIGTSANDGTGDPLRTSFRKTNENFTELYDSIVTYTSDLINDSGFITETSELINSSNNTVSLGEDGNLTFPSGGVLGQVWGDGFNTELTLKSPTIGAGAAYVALSSANEENYVEVSNGGIALGVNFGTEGFKVLSFDTNSDLTAPGNVVTNGGFGQVGYNSELATWGLEATGGFYDVNLTAGNTTKYTAKLMTDGIFYLPETLVTGKVGLSTQINTDNLDLHLSASRDIKIVANNRDVDTEWKFAVDGSVTFPDGQVQSNAYSGGQGHMFMIDTNRTDAYTEVGSSDKPFKTFAAAIAAAEAMDDTTFSFVLMGCTVTENVSFANTSFTQVTISTSCRSVINGDITITEVPAMSQMFFRNIEVAGTLTITGDSTTNQFNSVNLYNTSFSGPVNITAVNAIALYEVAFFDEVTLTNVNYTYINGAQFNDDWNIIINDDGIIPSNGITPCIIIGFNFIANNVFMTKVGSGGGFLVFQPHMARMGLGAGVYAIPANFIFQPQGCAIRGEWTNSGSTTLRNTSFDKAILGTAPAYTGVIGGDRVIVDSVPASSAGAAGDRAGMIASDGTYLYVCTTDWSSPGTTDIWSRTSLSASNW